VGKATWILLVEGIGFAFVKVKVYVEIPPTIPPEATETDLLTIAPAVAVKVALAS